MGNMYMNRKYTTEKMGQDSLKNTLFQNKINVRKKITYITYISLSLRPLYDNVLFVIKYKYML